MKNRLTYSRALFLCLTWGLGGVLVCGQEPLPDVVVTGKADDLLGLTDSASKGRASPEDFLARPLARRGEILETIPGVVITQHAGGGKANQYFLRGFNLDHGTDFAISLEGMPLNMRTHAHGQGYTDLNPIIPEVLRGIDYAKGPYTAADGDLSSAGSANFLVWDLMPESLVRLEFGEYNYYRSLIAGSLPLPATDAPQGLTYALEYNYYDGPWTQPEEFSRWNGLLRYFAGDDDNHFSATLMAYRGVWTSTDQIPSYAIQNGTLGRFDTVDPTAGGFSERYSLNLAWQQREDDVVTRANVYGIYYSLDLYSNFTYFLDFPPPVGDQFQQAEQRWIVGGNVARTWEHRDWAGLDSDATLGVQTRHDFIDGAGLWRTQQRTRHTTVRQDDLWEGSVGLYGEVLTRWNSWFRTVIGVRGDLFWFDTRESTLAANEGYDWAAIASPKFSAILGPWHETEFYLNFGTGFHSNDARGVNTRIDPNTGLGVSTVDPLVRTVGAEIGVRTQAVPDVTSTLSLFWLQSDSELVYVGDAGTNEPGPASRRIGVELATYWRPNSWFSADGELALTYARFRNSPGMDHIPNSVPVMFSGGFNLGAQGNDTGWFTGMRARIFANRPLEESNTYTGRDSVMLNGTVGYRCKRWEAAVDCLNLLNRADNDIEYYYESSFGGVQANDVHFHPVEPRMFRFRVTYRF